MLAVHAEAFRSAPRSYLAALWWRLRGKRLRARARFAPLLGTASKAYDLWQLSEDVTEDQTNADNVQPQIIALIDIAAGQDGLNATLASLTAEGITALLAGSNLSLFTQLAQQIDGNEYLWLMPLAPGDVLAPGTMQAYGNVIAQSDAQLVYADDDLLDNAGRRTSPHFKPNWNSELFHHFDYLTGASIIRTSRAELESLSGHNWARDLISTAARQGTPIHIRRVLHHRRLRPRPVIPVAIEIRSNELPPASVLVPTRNRVDLLRPCLEGLANTDYPDLEIVVVDNDSDDPATLAYISSLAPARYRVLRQAGDFNFSTINNHAATYARGKLLCLLNNDVEVVEPHWLATMAVQATRENIGAVGARLLYPDGRIQHAGVVLGVGGGAAHAHRLMHPDEEGYFHRHSLPQLVSAVTAACLVVMKDRFLAVGGLDERNFAVAFNDVDLCMRLNKQGWQALYEPRATLVHHESRSRGFDRDPIGAARLAGELAALKRLWGTDKQVDPFHHPKLSQFSERFVMGL